MNDFVMPLMLGLDAASLTMSLVNIGSATGADQQLADAIETALRPLAHLSVERIDHAVIARTEAGHEERLVVAGHLDTAASEKDPLAYVEMGRLFGLGASDAKGALAMTLKAAAVSSYGRDVTFIYFAGGRDTVGLNTVGDELLQCDFALLAEPTTCAVVAAEANTLDHPAARRLIGLTEVAPVVDASSPHGLARFASLGIPAVAFGPGDPAVAGTAGEFVPTAQLAHCEFALRQWLSRES